MRTKYKRLVNKTGRHLLLLNDYTKLAQTSESMGRSLETRRTTASKQQEDNKGFLT